MKNKSKKIRNKKFVKCKRKIIKNTTTKRYIILLIIIILLIVFLIGYLFYVQIINNNYYKIKLSQLTKTTVLGNSSPRGRIYDRNGKVIVDNESIKVISYKRKRGTTTKDEIKYAYLLGSYIELNYDKLGERELKTFLLLSNPDLALSKITDDEWQRYKERKITTKEIEEYKLERVSEEELNLFTDIDREAAYIYTLMNNGYSYNEKIIKKQVSNKEYALVAENIEKLPGFYPKTDWDRVYPYSSVFKSVLGSVSTNETGIPYELKDHYLSLGYSLNDRVGTSYLEYQYEDLLKGEKDVYQVTNSGENILIHEGKRGKDIVLSIDIDLQKEVERILEEELMRAKGEANTENYNKSFVVVSNPKTGEILAMAGKQIVKQNSGYTIYDYTPGVISSSVVPGSIVKGASHIVGYNNGALNIGEVRWDDCLKIASTPLKCSWKYLGKLDDITALKYSSNTYQYRTAIKVGGGYYSYNYPLVLDTKAFDIYRNTFAEFGLGVKTGIDLPNETLGFKGTGLESGLLLDFAIGQYDTYTPIQLVQYINTVANNGVRVSPYLLKAVYEPTNDSLTNLIKETETTVLNKVNTKEEYFNRVKMGFKEVMEYGGTGSGYISHDYNPAGKTGTSQSFIDTNGDKKIDTETISNTFAAYAPYDNPIVSFTVVSPDIYTYNSNSTTRSYVNIRIAKEVSKKFFEIYQ